jgi:cytochrome P450 family 619
MIFINVWGLHHDESRYTDHDVFDPDRYLGSNLLAAEYANSPDFENRDHYGYGEILLRFGDVMLMCRRR